ncbi:LOB domain-containing protein 2 [Magnolia sinica]|uniref:LOB domain-containing protein 2 n=1 Tax=Magnolia sinica TaxID=86752 RepID=UPI002659C975|nr:LOB domain-containing protein 2 [Magnolia sinica]
MEKDGKVHQACASCKHQRKGCRPDCVLAPYFPVEKTQKFQAVHKVFGVSNTQKLIKDLDTKENQSKAVSSIIWEAEWRLLDPINGCWGEYKKLLEEVKMLRRKIANCPMCSGAIFKQNPFGWTTNNNITNTNIVTNNNSFGYANTNGNLLLEPHATSYLQGLEKSSQGGDPLSIRCTPHSMDGLNQHYFIEDQLREGREQIR